MKYLFITLSFLCFCFPPASAQIAIRTLEMVIEQNPTCNQANGIVSFIDSSGLQQGLSLALYTHPDSALIGTGYHYTGLKQGNYLLKVINASGITWWETYSLGNFSFLNKLRFANVYLPNGAFPDTCTASKGRIHLGRNATQATLDSLSKMQWTWSTGQTGLNATNLKANQTHWVTASQGENCPYIFPVYFSETNGEDDFNLWGSPIKNIRTHLDTLFFEIRNINSLQVGFPFDSRPYCAKSNGVLVARVINGGTAPFQWKWKHGASTDTLKAIESGNYAVRVTDANGCEGIGWHFLSPYQNPDFSAIVNLLKADSCFFGSGKAQATAQGGSRPYLYKWNESDLTADSTIDSLPTGYHFFSVIDSDGCIFNKNFQIPNQTPLQATAAVHATDCEGHNGSVTISGSGGVEPYRMRWYHYPEFTGLQFDSLTSGYYGGYLEDANGCKSVPTHSYIAIPENCYRDLRVDLFLDEAGECIKQSSYLPIHNFTLKYRRLNTYYHSPSMGSINQIRLLPGVQDVKVLPVPHFTPACLNPDWGIPNLTFTPNSPFQVRSVGLGTSETWLNYRPVLVAKSPFRLGFATRFELIIENAGNKLIPPSEAEITLPSEVTFIGSPFPFTQTATNKIQFSTSPIPLGESASIFFDVKLDTSAALGINKTFQVNLMNLPNESNLVDNEILVAVTTVGAFDPNDISVHPSPRILPTETELNYQIRFQNLGNYYAENVVLIDTLPDEIDVSTFSFAGSSHWVSSIEIKGQVLTVRYLGIRLAAAQDNEPKSHGYFRFSVKRKTGLMLGTRIRNSASIYFDFNAPVKTNVSQTVIALPGTDFARRFSVYPNPGNEQFRIMDSDVAEVQIFDLAGKRLGTLKANEDGFFSLTTLPGGMYYIRFKEDGKTMVEKLIVQKI